MSKKANRFERSSGWTSRPAPGRPGAAPLSGRRPLPAACLHSSHHTPPCRRVLPQSGDFLAGLFEGGYQAMARIARSLAGL